MPRRLDLVIALALLLATLFTYAQVRHHDFVNYDDPDYITENRHVLAGVTAEGARWAFTSTDAGNWFPLTWLSHMADTEWFGLDAGRHHVTSLVLHGLATLILFATLAGITGERWPSALVAFLFALHPQHVESVAWAAERKDVLSGLFWMLTVAVYCRYAIRPARWRYAVVLVVFALAIMTKAMVVTLPFVLLLVDVWPLRRLADQSSVRPTTLPRALLEKLPLVALASVTAIVTFVAQRGAGAVASFETMTIWTRVSNAVVSVVLYLRDVFWPTRLAVFYPYPAAIALWQVTAAALLLAGVSFAVWRARRARPWLLVGWAWFVVSLLPVMGLIQVGAQSRADRYMYLPSVGIFVMLAWGLRDVVRRWPGVRFAVVGATLAACLATSVLAHRQIGYWQNSVTLFEHALEATAGNFVAHNNLGIALRQAGQVDAARAQFEAAIQAKPRYLDAIGNLAAVLLTQNRPADALALSEAARNINPNHPAAAINYGTALIRLGRLGEAEAHLRELTTRWPEAAKAHAALGLALAAQRRTDEALTELRTAAALDPNDPESRFNLGQLFVQLGRLEDARLQFTEAISLSPNFADAYMNLGSVLISQRRVRDAATAFSTAVRLQPDSARAHSNLGGALANLGDLDAAIEHFQIALRLEPTSAELKQNLEMALALRAQRGKSSGPGRY